MKLIFKDGICEELIARNLLAVYIQFHFFQGEIHQYAGYIEVLIHLAVSTFPFLCQIKKCISRKAKSIACINCYKHK